MSKKQNSVFDRMTEALSKAIDELETTNSYIYGIGGEIASLVEEMKQLNTNVAKLLEVPLKVTVDTESLANVLSETPKVPATEKEKPVRFPSQLEQ
jgi:archaellum component FlaC